MFKKPPKKQDYLIILQNFKIVNKILTLFLNVNLMSIKNVSFRILSNEDNFLNKT